MDQQLSFSFDADTDELRFEEAVDAIEEAKKLAERFEQEAKEQEAKEPEVDSEEPEVEPVEVIKVPEEPEKEPEEEMLESKEIVVGGQVRTLFAKDTYVVKKLKDNVAIVENPSTKDTHEICLKDLLGV